MTVRYEGTFHRFDMTGRRLCERHMPDLSTQVRFPPTTSNGDGSLYSRPMREGSHDCRVLEHRLVRSDSTIRRP